MTHFIGFDYKFDNFIDNFLLDITGTSSRTDCFDVLSEYSGYWIDKKGKKTHLSRRLSGESRWQSEEREEILGHALKSMLSELDIDNPEVLRINLLKLYKDFENGLPSKADVPQDRTVEYNMALKTAEILKSLSVGAQQEDIDACKKLYTFAAYAVICFFVYNGAQVASIPDEIKALLDNACSNTAVIKKSDFANTVLAISSATYPDKTGDNASDKSVLFTRYALFALIKKEFPNEETLLKLMGNDKISAEDLTDACKNVEIQSNDLKALFAYLEFVPHFNVYNGKKKPSGMILVSINGFVDGKTNEEYRKAMNALISAYCDLPNEFHKNVKSKLKREINFTVAELVLSIAYKGIFSASEYDRANLLEICHTLVSTHNHNNKYLFALIEKNREDEYLFKKYNQEDHECRRAIELFEGFFADNWQTEQSATNIGAKFLIWCDDVEVIFNLINGYCYDQKIWIEFASRYKGANTLREIIQKRLFKNCNVKSRDFLNHTVSFCQMATKENFKFLIFNARDEKYNLNSLEYIKYVIENLSSFPADKQKLINHGIRWMLLACNGYDPNYRQTVAKQLLNELDIDWDANIYAELISYKESIYNHKTIEAESPAIESFLKSVAALEQDRANTSLIQQSSAELKTLLLDYRVKFDNTLANAAEELIKILLTQEKQLGTIFATSDRLSSFSEEIAQSINDYAKNFLLNCDYAQHEHTTIARALRILKFNGYKNSEDALGRCYIKLSEIKGDNAIELLQYLLEGLTASKILSLLRSEKEIEDGIWGQATEWLLKNNRHQLAEQLNINIIFEFVDSLIDEGIADQISPSLHLSVLHFSKKQDCFADKVPSSDEFYSEILMESDVATINSKWLLKKAKKHNLSYNTALFHLCKILKDSPQRTAYICIEGLSKFYGNAEYLYYNNQSTDIRETYLFQKRKEIFSLLVSNPAIKNTARFYCWNLRRYAKVLPSSITELISDIINKDKYPSWWCDVVLEEVDHVERQDVWASKLKYAHSDLPTKAGLAKEIQEKFVPFLQGLEYSDAPSRVYAPESLIVVIKNGDSYQVIDGNRTVGKLIEESQLFGDFKINVVVIKI